MPEIFTFQILIYFAFLFWFLDVLRRTLFFLYFWQLKEYRLGRFISSVKERKEIIFSKNFIALIFFLIFLIIFRNTRYEYFWTILIILFYFAAGIFALAAFLGKKWKRPRLTIKMIALAGLVFLAEIFLTILFIKDFIIFSLLLEIFLVLFISFFVGIMQVPVFLAKKVIAKKATAKIRRFPNLIVIGITGSYGKTSVKEFLYAFLSSKYKGLKTEGNINTEIGVARFILKNLKEEHRFFICEMGAYKIGEIKAICEMVRPKVGILTGINQQHIDLFASHENIIKAKYELIEALPKDGAAIFNGDNNYCRRLYEKTDILNKKIICSKENGSCDFQARNIKVEKDYVYFDIIDKARKVSPVKANVLGGQNIQNILLAFGAAKELGMAEEEISRVFASFKPEHGRMKLYKNRSGLNIIDSSYSANPDGVMTALEYLKTWPQKKIVIMPSLIELGLVAKGIHKKIGEKISEACDLAIVTTKEHFNDIREGASQKEKIILIQDAKEIAAKIKEFCFEGDVVLLEGRVPSVLLKLLL